MCGALCLTGRLQEDRWETRVERRAKVQGQQLDFRATESNRIAALLSTTSCVPFMRFAEGYEQSRGRVEVARLSIGDVYVLRLNLPIVCVPRETVVSRGSFDTQTLLGVDFFE
jgi:hypothetical protein